MLHGSERAIDNQEPMDIILVTRVMRVGMPHHELKWEIPTQMFRRYDLKA